MKAKLRPRCAALPAALLLCCPAPAFAESDAAETPEILESPAGHSAHGEVFNEGPRQAAVPIPGTGEVRFEVSASSEEAQRFFNQGVGQLHGYWYFEAERSFRQAAKLDPDCAMAYWGMAMANFRNEKRGRGFIEEAVARRDGASERERRWIDSLAAYFDTGKGDSKKRLRDLVRALEKIVFDHPDDVEAQAFLLHQIFYNHSRGHPVASHLAVHLLAEQILQRAPLHPANHYQIHLWDREDAARALAAAARCGPSAPAIAHMWHMPGHIYSRLHRHADAAWHFEASARVDHAHMQRYFLVPDQIHNFAHNNEWLVRVFNNLGRLERSVELASNMVSLPRLAKFKGDGDDSAYDPSRSSWQHGRQRLRDTLVRFEQWERLIAESAEEGGLLAPDGKSITEADHHRFLGIARFETGDPAGGRGSLARLEELLAGKAAERDEAAAAAREEAAAEGGEEKALETAAEEAGKEFDKDIEDLENKVRELRVYEALAGTPPDHETARELLPDLKGVAGQRLALLWLRAGDEDKAVEEAAKAVRSDRNEVLPLAVQVRVLHAAGRDEEAREAFEGLREIAHQADLDQPALAELAGLARTCGWPEDWRLDPGPADDIGERPALDSLGPFRWSPPSAPGFELPDASGESVALARYGGRPVLVIFYLGRECTHCMEQLNAFAPLAADYAAAGIELVAVSTDSPEGLARTFLGEEDGGAPFPFPLLADPAFEAFRAYRAYDDFEDMPLHGTFLIDGAQRIRWLEIGYEPFMHPQWLLEECRRLLAFDEAP